ncbi:CheR family methyltransferase [Alkaliphilus hydrothermalis]|uniref:Chemotaxis protein methyltransferase CheR n=1 Tax=Alkaliphilus hydrothermalis TaxID=1482730 RepID=A0ABS2NPV2_9FIRM|nr:protein-glutamate O-methyltransferase CheR [Alkaliphilus hydrothermalis]MBM7614962.1 chemotaxis protein methyltransferase CheR [Alkaliphilus hydrothermalis]
MEIDVHYDGKGNKEITIGGEIESDTDVEILKYHLHIDKLENIRITILDITMIKKAVVMEFHKLQRERGCFIYVLKPYLYSYLCKLGLHCKLIQQKTPPNQKATVEKERLKNSQLDKKEVIEFLQEINQCYGYDYTDYQIDSIIRRIKISMVRQGVISFHDFKQNILNNEDLFEQLFIDLSVNITEFFRDPEVFVVVKEKILPDLDSFPHIKIWCAGCSTGQEPYSIAILLKELGMLNKAQIYATDINPYVIQEAINGLYPLAGIDKNIENYRLAKGKGSFMENFKVKGSYVEIDKSLKERILFFQHSLVGSGILNEFQLIFCRNVLIYLDVSLQKSILQNFYHSLDANGFLVLGKSEGVFSNEGPDSFSSYLEQDKKIFKPRDKCI